MYGLAGYLTTTHPPQNEVAHARLVAQRLGTEYTELYAPPADCIEAIPRLPTLYDEPLSDSSQVPTFLVSQLSRQRVTVSLSGDAGDELFTGYDCCQFTANTWVQLSCIPRPIRRWAARVVTSVSPSSWYRIVTIKTAVPLSAQWTSIGEKLHKGTEMVSSRPASDLYLGMVSGWRNPTDVIINGAEPATSLSGSAPDLSHLDTIERMMLLDLLIYLPDDISLQGRSCFNRSVAGRSYSLSWSSCC